MVRLEKWAAFVDVGNNFTALLHIDEIAKPAGSPDATADLIYKLDDEIKVGSLMGWLGPTVAESRPGVRCAPRVRTIGKGRTCSL